MDPTTFSENHVYSDYTLSYCDECRQYILDYLQNGIFLKTNFRNCDNWNAYHVGCCEKIDVYAKANTNTWKLTNDSRRFIILTLKKSGIIDIE
jgi:hypothetical protein